MSHRNVTCLAASLISISSLSGTAVVWASSGPEPYLPMLVGVAAVAGIVVAGAFRRERPIATILEGAWRGRFLLYLGGAVLICIEVGACAEWVLSLVPWLVGLGVVTATVLVPFALVAASIALLVAGTTGALAYFVGPGPGGRPSGSRR